LRFDVCWQSDAAHHTDSLFLPQVDLWRNDLPRPVQQAVMNKSAGYGATISFAPGQLVADRLPGRLLKLRADQFNRRFLGRGPLEPRRGRFYPKAILTTAYEVRGADRTPIRVVAADKNGFTADLSHALAGKDLEITVTVDAIADSDRRRDGPNMQIRSRLIDLGPGMQGRWQGQPTDFFADDPFTRLDDDDPGFYERARLVDHLDTTAIAEISALYGRLIRPRSRILDLMSSWHSHLPQASRPDAVVGLGMNAEELARNPILTERVVHDMNADPRLPFDDASFDAVICTVSVEYLTQPFAVFREMARVLAPAGIAVMTFSNRWFPTKVIRIWDQVHEFERPGLVLEYFRESGRFRDFNTWSLRGLPRPAEDKYAHRLDQSDPVHAVWARRDGEPRVRL
jgi:SAM-dependent methyltransferase